MVGHHEEEAIPVSWARSWWQSLTPPISVRKTATRACTSSDRNLMTQCGATVLLSLCFMMTNTCLLEWWTTPKHQRQGALWSFVARHVVSSLPGAFLYYSACLIIPILLALIVIAVKLKRSMSGDCSPNSVATGRLRLAMKATAASVAVLFWTGLLMAASTWALMLSIRYEAVLAVDRQTPSLLAWMDVIWKIIGIVMYAVWLAWLPVMASLCGLRIIDHLRRLRCVACGYDLRGTSGTCCSECGMGLPPVS
jgi:hypothetical protein